MWKRGWSPKYLHIRLTIICQNLSANTRTRPSCWACRGVKKLYCKHDLLLRIKHPPNILIQRNDIYAWIEKGQLYSSLLLQVNQVYLTLRRLLGNRGVRYLIRVSILMTSILWILAWWKKFSVCWHFTQPCQNSEMELLRSITLLCMINIIRETTL